MSNDQKIEAPKTKWFRPHVRDLNKQEAMAKEKSNGSIFGMFVALAAGGMAVMSGGSHVAQSLASQTPKAPTNPTPSNAPGDINVPKIDTNGIKSNIKGVGRNVVRHADDIGQAYDNYTKDDEKNNTTTAAKELKSKEYD